MSYRNVRSAILLLACFSCVRPLVAQDDLPALLSRFQSEHDQPTKEGILLAITQRYPNAGPALLTIASKTRDTQTRWLAISGIGWLKFKNAAPFLRRSLSSTSNYVRANSAMALGAIGDTSSAPELIRMLKGENDTGAIEQTALALQVLGAKQAVPVLKARAHNPKVQTRIWILGAIGALGSKEDVPFFATFLFDDSEFVAEAAAHVLETFTGQDFGFPSCYQQGGPCGPGEGIRNAQTWWGTHGKDWEQ